jgi:hypothetical protein
MKFNLFMTSILVVMLSMVVSKVVYFGFTPNYEANQFSRKAFDAKFDRDGYQYRVLSKYMLYATDAWLGTSMKEGGAESRIGAVSGGASQRFYYSFYYLNTLFLALTSLMVVLLLDRDGAMRFSDTEKTLLAFFAPVMIGFTQFAVHYYDLSSYFLELLTLYVFLKGIGQRYGQTMGIVMALIVVSALNRESAEVSVALVGVLLLARFGLTRRVVWSIAGMALCWLGTYLVLRVVIGPGAPAPKVIDLAGAGGVELDMLMMGVIFWVLFIYLPFALAASENNKWLIGGFFLFSLPYIVSAVMGGDLWAIRTFVPLFLGALFLCKAEMVAKPVFSLRRQPTLTGVRL